VVLSKKTIIDGSTITFFDAPTKIVGHLTASGNISASGYLVAQNITASANISASGTGSFGMVGIGTTTPAQKLDVKDGFIQVSGSSASGYGYLLNRAGQDIYSIRHLDGGLTINNETDNRKEMTFDGDGNVGIGATSPTAKLHVSGNIWASGSSGQHHSLSKHKCKWHNNSNIIYRLIKRNSFNSFNSYYSNSYSN
jgi:hypothetical protein